MIISTTTTEKVVIEMNNEEVIEIISNYVRNNIDTFIANVRGLDVEFITNSYGDFDGAKVRYEKVETTDE